MKNLQEDVSKPTMTSQRASSLTVVEELDRFMSLEHVSLLAEDDEDFDIFKYWDSLKSIFPRLHVVAMRYLLILATSASSERIYSVTAKSKPHMVKVLSFLNQNKSRIKYNKEE